MAKLVHEVWDEIVDGMVLHSCCLAGPRGNGQRSYLAPDAKLIETFEAASHFEAMTLYHNLLGRERYTTDDPHAYEPYPEQWRLEQQT